MPHPSPTPHTTGNRSLRPDPFLLRLGTTMAPPHIVNSSRRARPQGILGRRWKGFLMMRIDLSYPVIYLYKDFTDSVEDE
uniref:Uncharacterized protein n=1 Tax=Aegilops tauschii subsp. strangulata TaxID=200361 RepID=A0A452Z0J4_AEGTS